MKEDPTQKKKVISSRTELEPTQVKLYSQNILHKNRIGAGKIRRPVSKIRKFILALLLPVEVICEIFQTKPRFSLFAIYGVIILIGKFISIKVAMGMAILMLFTFALVGRKERDGETIPKVPDDSDWPPIFLGFPYYYKYYPKLFRERSYYDD